MTKILSMIGGNKLNKKVNGNNHDLVQQNYVNNTPLLPSILSENTTSNHLMLKRRQDGPPKSFTFFKNITNNIT